jgi:hypothetical protein
LFFFPFSTTHQKHTVDEWKDMGDGFSLLQLVPASNSPVNPAVDPTYRSSSQFNQGAAWKGFNTDFLFDGVYTGYLEDHACSTLADFYPWQAWCPSGTSVSLCDGRYKASASTTFAENGQSQTVSGWQLEVSLPVAKQFSKYGVRGSASSFYLVYSNDNGASWTMADKLLNNDATNRTCAASYPHWKTQPYNDFEKVLPQPITAKKWRLILTRHCSGPHSAAWASLFFFKGTHTYTHTHTP